MSYHELEAKIHNMVDDLQGLCATSGLSNTANEEVVVTSVFLYKFLNDKFMYNLNLFAKELDMSADDILHNDKMLNRFYRQNSTDVAFAYEDTIEHLINHSQDENFYTQFDNALIHIASNERNEAFSVETAGGEKVALFEPLSKLVDEADRNSFVQAIFGIIAQDRFDFSEAFGGGFDFYASIFEYLIKNYNVASGTYAEYFTPQAVSSAIAKILVGMSDKIEAAEIYDPAAGSGSLILHLAHELGQEAGMNRAIIYTQDISAKSSRFLRLNMMLNGKTESLGNIIKGDSLLTPAHYNIEHDPNSGLKHFDYITMNPPFRYDFSTTRNTIESKWENTGRFFAGIPNIPANDKEKMAVYLPFIQHVLFSMKDDGKAAIVVPTGFLTAKSKIEKTIRQTLVDNRWIKGVISMPPNIFANTGTNVSVLFIDKTNDSDTAIFIDASNLGTKVKVGKNQKTVLSNDEIKSIIETFIKHESVKDYSVTVSYDDIAKKNYSFSAGQFFDVVIEYFDISQDEFEKRMMAYKNNLNEKFAESHKLEKEIMKQIEGLKL